MVELSPAEGTSISGSTSLPLDAPRDLPVQLTSFVGRRTELAQIRDLLAGTRLLTLLGPGGCGKTRLALQVAGELSAEYQGVAFADLAHVDDPDAVATTLARALGLRDDPRRPRVEGIVDRLGAESVLVLLDNCEHLVDASAALVETLLLRCPSVQVVATSREPLDVAGETGWRVPSLSLPVRKPSCAAELEASEAVALFAERARRVRTGFVVGDSNAAAVAEICCRLDGIPLAIELAAARARVLGPGQIAAGLDEAFRLLTGGGRRAVARQRTLRASVDWSHALLTEPERVLFRRLAPFAGEFDLSAAEAVGSGPDLTSRQVLDQLTLLVDKSLVHLVGERQSDGCWRGEARFRLLETMRQYAGEQLSASGEDLAARRRHRGHFLAVAETESGLASLGRQQDHALDRLTADLDNLRAAFTWSRSSGEPEGALRIAAALFPLWRMRGRRLQGCAWLDDALGDLAVARDPTERAPGQGTSASRVRALVVRARIEVNIFDPAAAAGVEESVRLARELGDRALLARALIGGGAYASRGPHSHRELLAESVMLARELGDTETLAEAQGWLALVSMCAGEPAEALTLLADAVALSTERGDLYTARVFSAFTGLCLLMQGEVRSAGPVLAAAARDAEALGDRTTASHTRAFLGWADASGGDREASSDASARALAEAQAAGGSAHELFALLGCGMAALAQGQSAAAASSFAHGWQLAGGAPGFGDFFGGPWAEAALAQGDIEAARTRADEAASRTVDPELGWQAGWALSARARVAVVDGDLDRAETLAHRALAIRHRIEDRAGVADSLELLAILIARQKSFTESGRLLGAASAARVAGGCHRFTVHDGAVERTVSAIRTALGDASFYTAHAEGCALDCAEAVAYASRGRGSRKRPKHGWAGLTPAERDVVALLATGLSNTEIGARLFVSPRTVGTHLSHVYAKLGVTSRLQLAQEAARRGAPGSSA